MGKTIRLKDKSTPGIKELDLKDYKDFGIQKKPKMEPFSKKQRI